MSQEPVPQRSPEEAAMFELGQKLKDGKVTRRALDLVAHVGHRPALDLLKLIGGEVPETPKKPEEWLEVIESWEGAPVRALIGSCHERIHEAEKMVGERGITQEMIIEWLSLVDMIEDYFMSKDSNLGLELSEAGHKLDEGIGWSAQMAAEGYGAPLSDSRQMTLAIDLELERILILLKVAFHPEHSLGTPFPNMKGVQREILPWALEGKDPIRERFVARGIVKEQGDTRGDIVNGLDG